MRYFLASDVLYGRSREDISTGFEDAGLTQDEKLPDANFLPEPVEDWLDASSLDDDAGLGRGRVGRRRSRAAWARADRDARSTGRSSAPTPPTRSAADAPYSTRGARAQNQGENDESDVAVDFSISGGTETIEGDGDDRRDQGRADQERQARDLARSRPPARSSRWRSPCGPVPGEELADNNTSTYTITFELAVTRIAYLGPPGTFSEDALLAAVGDRVVETVPRSTFYEAIVAVTEGEADRALVPFENSIEGSVRATLDALAFDAPSATDRRRVRPRRHPQPDRADRAGARRRGGRRLPPAGQRPVRSLHPREPSERRGAGRPEHRRGRADGGESDEPWAALGGISGRDALRRGRPARGHRGRARQRHPLRLGRARGNRRRGRRARGGRR